MISDVHDSICFFPENTKLIDYSYDFTIVDGDLEIVGLLKGERNSLLIVMGDLYIDRAIIRSEIIVIGNLNVKNIIALDSQGDDSLCVGKDVNARFYVQSDQGEKVKGKWNVNESYERGEDPRDVLVQDVFTKKNTMISNRFQIGPRKINRFFCSLRKTDEAW